MILDIVNELFKRLKRYKTKARGRMKLEESKCKGKNKIEISWRCERVIQLSYC